MLKGIPPTAQPALQALERGGAWAHSVQPPTFQMHAASVHVLRNYLWARTTSAHAANDGASQSQNARETRQDHYSKETTLNSLDVIAVVNCGCEMIVGKTD